MKKFYILSLINIFTIIAHCQVAEKKVYNTNMLQGVWQMEANYTLPNQSSFYKTFHIFKGKKWLTIQTDLKASSKFSVVVTKYGFSETASAPEIWQMDSLKNEGSVFVSISENANIRDKCIVSTSIFHVVKKTELVVFSDECIYLERLPKTALNMLYTRREMDKRDYIKEFLEIDVRKTINKNCQLYNEKLKKIDLLLNNGELITILDEKKKFYKIEYENAKQEVKTYWIKKTDVEEQINLLLNK